MILDAAPSSYSSTVNDLATSHPYATVVATSQSVNVVATNRDNAVKHGLSNVKVKALDASHMTTLGDKTFDVIVCSFGLAFMSSPTDTLKEFRRLLKPGGIALLSVPINPTRYETHEIPAITAADARWAHFSAHDHVRYYGMDFADRLKDVGFQVETFRMGPDDEVRYALLRDEWITIATRPAG